MRRRTPDGRRAPRRQEPVWVITVVGFGLGFALGGLLLACFLAWLDHELSQPGALW